MEENKEEKKKPLDMRMLEETEKSMETLLNDGITQENVKTLSELVDIHKDIICERKEMQEMNYRNYNGRRAGYDAYGENYGRGSYGEYGNYNGYGNYGDGSYGEYGRGGSYGARGRDMRYRGEDEMDRMAGEYGRYMENRNRYGAGEETDKSFHYMVEAYKDFTKVLFEEAQTPQQKQMLREAIQQSMM